MRLSLVSRIFYTIWGAAVSFLLWTLTLSLLSANPNTKGLDSVIFNMLWPGYAFGILLITIVNIADTRSRFPRDYWCLGKQRGLCIGSSVHFVRILCTSVHNYNNCGLRFKRGQPDNHSLSFRGDCYGRYNYGSFLSCRTCEGAVGTIGNCPMPSDKFAHRMEN
jgi:hypothetical protein